MRTTLIPLQEQVTGAARSGLWLLFATVGSALLIVCVNVGNLMLVRTTGRYREAAMRMALGASRSQLFGLILKEALVLVACGGGLGLLFAYLAVQTFVTVAPIDLPRLDEVRMNSSAVAFALGGIALSTLICGLVPAWRLSRTQPQDSLKGGTFNSIDSMGRIRFRETIVGVQVALTTVILVVSSLLIISFIRLMNVDKGIQLEHVVTQSISLTSPSYLQDAAQTRFIDEALAGLAAVPGVRSASVTNQIPLLGETWLEDLVDADKTSSENDGAVANFRFVGPDYWKTLGIPLTGRRLFEQRDRRRAVAVISQRVAQYLWPNQNPIGRRIRGVNGVPAEVVGVTGDAREGALTTDPPFVVYQPYWSVEFGGPSFVLRTEVEPAAAAGQIRSIIHSIDPAVPITQSKTMGLIPPAELAALFRHPDYSVNGRPT